MRAELRENMGNKAELGKNTDELSECRVGKWLDWGTPYPLIKKISPALKGQLCWDMLG